MRSEGEITVRLAVENRPDADFTGPVRRIDITARYRIFPDQKHEAPGVFAAPVVAGDPRRRVEGGPVENLGGLGLES